VTAGQTTSIAWPTIRLVRRLASERQARPWPSMSWPTPLDELARGYVEGARGAFVLIPDEPEPTRDERYSTELCLGRACRANRRLRR
jgi:hypothetical protein